MVRIRKKMLLIAAVGLLLVILSACGGKSQEGALKKISEKAAGIDGYKATMEMSMKTGKSDRNYDVDVWYKKQDADFYRVGLKNKTEEESQVILKNEEGVFVLTPELKKSFKFQTEWPENSSQPYLYQSIVNDVVTDKDATFNAEEDEYVFLTKTNYQNNTNLPYQEVHFDKKTLLPTTVQVMNEEKEVLITVVYGDMDVNPSFAKEDFQRKEIMENTLADTSVSKEADETFEILFPLETNGAELAEKQELDTDDGERVIMTYKGDQHFTLIQEKEEVVPTANMGEMTEDIQGELVNLGHSIGALDNNSVEWNYKGTSFILASDDMTADELVSVASSIEGKEIK